MSARTTHFGRLIVATATVVAALPSVGACDDNCRSHGGGSSVTIDYSAYYQWLQKLYEDRRQAQLERLEQLKTERLDRQLYHPPVTEIWAAEPLNALLTELQRLKAQGMELPEVQLKDDVLKHANLTAGLSTGNIGVFKSQKPLAWPVALRAAKYQTVRQHLDALTAQLIQQAKGGAVDVDDVQEAAVLLEKTQAQLKAEVARLSAPEYIQAKRFLNDLTEAVKVLKQPDAASHFNQDYAAQGRNVAELVQYMADKGLKFAPAAAADKASYSALHQALASCALTANANARPLVQ